LWCPGELDRLWIIYGWTGMNEWLRVWLENLSMQLCMLCIHPKSIWTYHHPVPIASHIKTKCLNGIFPRNVSREKPGNEKQKKKQKKKTISISQNSSTNWFFGNSKGYKQKAQNCDSNISFFCQTEQSKK
jgi:hypothetical protein